MAVVSFPNKELKGNIILPASKSISNRLLIIQALCEEPFAIDNLSEAQDTVTLKRLLKSEDEVLDVGPAGTTMRFLTAYLSNGDGVKTLTGSDRMKERPINILVDALRELGANIEYLGADGCPPLKIKGGALSDGEIAINGSVSSQYISALMLIAPTLPNGLTINLTGSVSSRPYIHMTRRCLKKFGATCQFKGGVVTIDGGGYKPNEIIVEADWSSASYWFSLVAVAEGADVVLKGLKKNSMQGDNVISEIFELLGVMSEFEEGGVRLIKTPLNTTHLGFDFSDCPDLAQTVIVTCAAMGISGQFTGIESLRIKETDRITALKTELEKLGAELKDVSEGVVQLTAADKLSSKGVIINTYNDHRMAMAFAPLALICKDIQIENPDVVVKSYPDFWDDLRSVGCVLTG